VETTITLRDLVDGKIIEASKDHITILKDNRKFKIETKTSLIKEINKQQ
jgi:hypothetical protein